MQSLQTPYNLMLLLPALSLFCSLPAAQSAKILAIFPFPGPSQYILVQPYLKALAARDHLVTVVNQFPQKQPVRNFRDVHLKDTAVYDTIFEVATVEHNPWILLQQAYRMVLGVTKSVHENAEFQALLQQEFDLIIIEALFLESLYGLGEHFKAPLIGISSLGADQHVDRLLGNTAPVSYAPTIFDGFTDRMTFMERLRNYYTTVVEKLLFEMLNMPQQELLYRKYFPKLQKSLREQLKSFSLIMLNQHFSVSFARPYLPNMIEVAGFHIDYQAKPLPTELAKFINESEHGVIYFSLGSNLDSKSLLDGKLQLIFNTFAALPQRVLWKFDNEELPGKPANVYISKWFSQRDVLAHPNVRLFITHGGLLSTLEAIHHGKPLVGMPIVFDQPMNIKNAVAAGYALSVDFKTFKGFDSAIREVLSNESYSRNVKKVSRRYHDRPMKPLDTAIYWTEYVLRHGGALHMRNAGLDLNYFQLHSWDVALVFYGVPLLALISVIVLLRKLIRFINSDMQVVCDAEQKKIN